MRSRSPNPTSLPGNVSPTRWPLPRGGTLAAPGEPLPEDCRQASALHQELRALDVVLDASPGRAASRRVEQEIGGAWVAVARLADAAGVQQVPLARLERDRRASLDVAARPRVVTSCSFGIGCWDVRVAVEA